MYDCGLLGQTEYVSKKMIEYLFDKSDEISFLLCSYYKTDNLPLFNFKSQKIIFTRDFWSMEGYVFYFNVNSNIKEYFLNIADLEYYIPTRDGNVFENLTLYKNKKVIFSVCSHEQDIYIDASIRDEMERFYKDVVKTDIVFNFVKAKYLYLQKHKEFRQKEITILYDLKSYVDQSKQSFIYKVPEYECHEEQYKFLVKKYMPKYIYFKLEQLTNFSTYETILTNLPNNFFNVLFYYRNIDEFL